MNKIIQTFFIFLFLTPFGQLFAASISLEKVLPAGSDLKVGDEVLVNVNLLSEGVEHNAVEGVLKIPPIFTIEKIVTGNSFVTVWLEDPSRFDGDTIDFSGITPSGYNKETGLVFSVVLKAVGFGAGGVTFTEGSVYENDGLGTISELRDRELELRIRSIKDGEVPYLISVRDVTPPEEFKVELVKSPDLFEGRYALVWNTRDQGSGIRSYDVHEGRRVFKQVSSPYSLENQHLNGKIKVVAYDNEGNVRISELDQDHKICIGVDCLSYMQLVVIFALVVIALVILWIKSRK
jgi:hypothetical protein